MKKDIRQQFKKAVIEAIHGVPYEEAIKKERDLHGCLFKDPDALQRTYISSGKERNRSIIPGEYKWRMERVGLPDDLFSVYDDKIYHFICLGLPITIGRAMQALKNKHFDGKLNRPFYDIDYFGNIALLEFIITKDGKLLEYEYICNWKLTKENGQECIDDDQTDETIEKLLKLF